MPTASVSRQISTPAACAAREPGGDAVRIRDAVTRAEGRGENAAGVETGRQSAGLVRVEPVHFHAETSLHVDGRAKLGDAAGARQQEQVAFLVKIDRPADRILEVFEEANRFDREPHVRVVRELVAHAARIAPGRCAGERWLALDQDDIRDAASRQVIRDTCAHAAAADDDNVRGSSHDVRRTLAHLDA